MKNKNFKEKVIMDFSGIYQKQKFYQSERIPHKEYQEEKISWVEVQDLTGCNCYCDGEAQDRIREKLKDYTGEGIHFIDSGNYHYVSRLWLEKIKEPFRLLVLDNHTDMQPPAFGGLLSCGGWVAASVEELSLLQEVILIGPDQEAYEQVPQELRRKVRFLSRESLREMTMAAKNQFFCELDRNLPLYISVDKDVLCKEDASTTWSQGDMRIEELNEFLKILFEKQRVIGMDVCGECDPDTASSGRKNEDANRKLLRLWESCTEAE